MPRTRKKSVREMRAEMQRLQDEIAQREQDDLLEELVKSKEFKLVAKQVAKLSLDTATLGDLFVRSPKRVKTKRVVKPRGKVPPKYRHPENPELVWSGRGNRPNWVKEALAANLTLDDLLIKE